MTSRAADEPRLKPVHARPARGARLGGRAAAAAAAAAAAILILFGAQWWLLRERPAPRPAAPPPPNLEEQIADARRVLKQNPQDLDALTRLGTLLFEKGQGSYIEAINDLETARDLGALDPRIFYCLGLMYQEEGLYPYALTEYQRFLRHDPSDEEIRLLEAKLYYRLGMFPEAVDDYERLQFQDPKNPIVLENLGLGYWGAKRDERALATFRQLKAYGGDYARRAEFYLGEMALQAGEYPQAAEHFAASGAATAPLADIAPERAQAAIATAAAALGRWDQAKAAWQAVLKATPRDAKARRGLRTAERRLAAAARAAKRAARRAKAKKSR